MDTAALTSLVVDLFGGDDALGRTILSEVAFDDAVNAGLPRQAVDNLLANLKTGFSHAVDDELVSKIVIRTDDPLKSGRFGPDASLVVARIARLFAMAIRSFGEKAAAARFMMDPHLELNGIAPFDAAFTVTGAHAVETVIQRGLHGLPA